LPNFLIAGAAKCGTTSLAAWVGAHPQAFVAAQKELYFFEQDELFAQGPEWYAAHFAQAGEAIAVGEATPGYMFYPWAVERIAQTLPEVRIVVCLRHPADRAHSHYLHWRDRLMIEPRSFAEAVSDELAAGGREVAAHRLDPPYFAYLARGWYLEQLDRLEATFGSDRVHVVLLDDMRNDAAGVFRSVCSFLGLDPSVAPPSVGSSENAYRRHRNAAVLRRLVRSQRIQRMRPVLARALVASVFREVRTDAPRADPATRGRLLEFYREHNLALGERLGRDLSAWNV
jgi:hypothetical protein